MTTTLDTVQQLATELTPLEQIQLIAYLTERIAPALRTTELPKAALSSTDSWAKLEAFWQSIEALGPAAPSVTNQLLDDRQQRQAMIEGR
ncbi:hypothetical protein [Candidatus Viridilinea mediisalina]|uniref:Uncharacterized protein n=1 Tax=Candidatus Viridilinea mediisalina TaxID=2024553 RepID=A0A2A6RLP9_9CHLR|nr:hypothetical protein [Candidatus Viridilinea mediisalina]PDW03799.1 hypothetical protein CJ255_07015 [Candidatus Viridilinea mediisalina]